MALISNMDIAINVSMTLSLIIAFTLLQKRHNKHTKDKTAKREKPTKDKKFTIKLKIKL